MYYSPLGSKSSWAAVSSAGRAAASRAVGEGGGGHSAPPAAPAHDHGPAAPDTGPHMSLYIFICLFYLSIPT